MTSYSALHWRKCGRSWLGLLYLQVYQNPQAGNDTMRDIAVYSGRSNGLLEPGQS